MTNGNIEIKEVSFDISAPERTPYEVTLDIQAIEEQCRVLAAKDKEIRDSLDARDAEDESRDLMKEMVDIATSGRAKSSRWVMDGNRARIAEIQEKLKSRSEKLQDILKKRKNRYARIRALKEEREHLRRTKRRVIFVGPHNDADDSPRSDEGSPHRRRLRESSRPAELLKHCSSNLTSRRLKQAMPELFEN